MEEPHKGMSSETYECWLRSSHIWIVVKLPGGMLDLVCEHCGIVA